MSAANKRMLSDWFSVALQTSRKYGRHVLRGKAQLMRTVLIALLVFLTGCARHSSLNYLYPEFAGKEVISTQKLYLVEITHDKQMAHPDYEILFSFPSYRPNGQIIELRENTKLFITGFYEHFRFTEAGTEVRGWTKVDGKKLKFYKTLNTSYSGLVKETNLPWKLVQ